MHPLKSFRPARAATLLAVAGAAAVVLAAEGARPPLPRITKPIQFDTPEADAVMAALQVFPSDNWWNRDISALPVHADSAKMIAATGADSDPGRRSARKLAAPPQREPEGAAASGRDARRVPAHRRRRPPRARGR